MAKKKPTAKRHQSQSQLDWYEQDGADGESFSFVEYDVAAVPNDFNLSTIYSFIDSGSVLIPHFQRHYVWDIRRASKLIESLVMGIPVPQVFLYELERNRFSIVDGQQRLLTIYYFMKGRFPRKEKRAALRRLAIERGAAAHDGSVLQDDEYFEDFALQLFTPTKQQPHPLEGVKYATLSQYKESFDLRTIRNVVVKQLRPADDHAAMFEIFGRLNSGGVNLSAQELRSSLYPSKFLELLAKLNLDDRWRILLNQPDADSRMKDVEFLLRGFAMAVDGKNYRGPMSVFLNRFCQKMQRVDKISYLSEFFDRFLDVSRGLGDQAFFGQSRRFSISVFESVLHAAGNRSLSKGGSKVGVLTKRGLKALKGDKAFAEAAASRTADEKNVRLRLQIAAKLLVS